MRLTFLSPLDLLVARAPRRAQSQRLWKRRRAGSLIEEREAAGEGDFCGLGVRWKRRWKRGGGRTRARVAFFSLSSSSFVAAKVSQKHLTFFFFSQFSRLLSNLVLRSILVSLVRARREHCVAEDRNKLEQRGGRSERASEEKFQGGEELQFAGLPPCSRRERGIGTRSLTSLCSWLLLALLLTFFSYSSPHHSRLFSNLI